MGRSRFTCQQSVYTRLNLSTGTSVSALHVRPQALADAIGRTAAGAGHVLGLLLRSYETHERDEEVGNAPIALGRPDRSADVRDALHGHTASDDPTIRACALGLRDEPLDVGALAGRSAQLLEPAVL